MIDVAAIKLRYQTLSPVLDERARRRFAASEALAAARGGIAAVSEATSIARRTIGRGLDEVRGKASDTAQGGIRRAGAGRKPLTKTDPTLLCDLEKIVDPSTRGDPLSPLKWTTRSLSKLAGALQAMGGVQQGPRPAKQGGVLNGGHGVGRDVVGTLLKRLGYSLQANRKTLEGSHHVDRDAQFQHIARTVQRAIEADQPAISVDTKKKELVGACDPLLVERHGARAIPRGPQPDHHGRWRRLQRITRAPVEGRTPETRRRAWPRHHGPAPAARHQQMEQDRASALLVHLAQLERTAAHGLPDHRRTHRGNDVDNRPDRPL